MFPLRVEVLLASTASETWWVQPGEKAQTNCRGTTTTIGTQADTKMTCTETPATPPVEHTRRVATPAVSNYKPDVTRSKILAKLPGIEAL